MAADEILSTEELDELMRAVSDGNVGTIAHSDASRHTALPYDFTAPRRIIANILPTLDMINGRFADAVGSTVYNMLQQRPQVSISAPQMVTMGEYMRTLPLPASINQVKVLPLRGTALMVLEPHLVTLMVDGFFGGTSQDVSPRKSNKFTIVEHRIIRKLLGELFADLRNAWEPVMDLEFSHAGSESNPAHTSIPAASEAEQMIVTVVQVIFEGGASAFHLLLPYSMLEPFRRQLTSGVQLSDEPPQEAFSSALMDGLADIELPLSCTLARTDISIDELLRLKPGDVIPVQIPTNVLLEVEGMPAYKGIYGTLGATHAVQVAGPAWQPASNSAISTT